MSTTQSPQMCGFMDPTYYQQQQQAFQVSPQHIQRLRHLQQQAALQQQPGYPQQQQQQQQQQQMLAIPQYQPQQPQTYQQPIQSSMEPSDSLDMGPNKASKRAEHNAIERARREHLNTKFQQLAHSLPNLQNDRRPSKGTIIERTLEFVKHTVHKEERYKNEIKELSRANRQLMRQVTSRSTLLADSNSNYSGDEDDGGDDDNDDDELVATTSYYQMEDDRMDNTCSDDSISRKSSCSSFAMQSMSTTNGASSTTTSPSLDYQSVLSQWENPQQQQQQQQQYYYQQHQQLQQQQSDMYLSPDDLMNDNYLLSGDGNASFFNPMKSSMDAINTNNNLYIKYESSFPG